MDKASLVPFGKIERYQKPRRLGKKEPHARSTIIARWDVLLPIIGDTIATMPQLRNRLQELVNQRDKEIRISRSEFDQLGTLLGSISDVWTSFVAEAKASIRERLETWHQGSRRGMFRLLVLMAGVIIENRRARSGEDLRSKGLGGMIKKALKLVSNGSIEAKPGSLYVAINDFASDDLISNYDLDADGPVKVTQKGKAFILGAMDALKGFLDLLSKVGLLGILKQEHLTDAKSINDAIFEVATPAIDSDALARMTATFQAMIDAIAASPAFKGARDVDVKADIDSWQDSLNRGIIDVFILGSFLSRPSYGNALIIDAEAALGIPTGTLYPKLRDFHERGLISPIPEGERLASLNKAVAKSQGPRKVYYDITSRGALYLLAIASLHFADLSAFLKFTQDLLGCVVEPVPATKSK
jgi:DNA-binding PadR family transcriptional regulator